MIEGGEKEDCVLIESEAVPTALVPATPATTSTADGDRVAAGMQAVSTGMAVGSLKAKSGLIAGAGYLAGTSTCEWR